jgi:hypothetical protein
MVSLGMFSGRSWGDESCDVWWLTFFESAQRRVMGIENRVICMFDLIEST